MWNLGALGREFGEGFQSNEEFRKLLRSKALHQENGPQNGEELIHSPPLGNGEETPQKSSLGDHACLSPSSSPVPLEVSFQCCLCHRSVNQQNSTEKLSKSNWLYWRICESGSILSRKQEGALESHRKGKVFKGRKVAGEGSLLVQSLVSGRVAFLKGTEEVSDFLTCADQVIPDRLVKDYIPGRG